VFGWAVALDDAPVAILLAGFAYASVADLRVREVSDRLWQLLGVLGVALGAVLFGAGGLVPLLLWLVVGLLTLEHLVSWDGLLPASWQDQADRIELAGYAIVVAIVAIAVGRYGLGPSAVPVGVIAVLATVLLARALFEVGALYGGADAKALMIAGVLVPTFPHPILAVPATVTTLGAIPFSIDLLTDAALLAIVIPLFLAARNVYRGEFAFPRGFTGYSLPVGELPTKFVWVRDPAAGNGTSTDDAETSEDDARIRREAAERLALRGIARVWVSPQLPFLVLMALGAVAAILAGNLVLDGLALA
jgi:archaeal preflagellin peptidase FlaK